MLHVAITRRVRPGREAEFESRLEEFFRRAEDAEPGSRAYMIRPLGEGEQDYGILRSFPDAAAQERFYGSELYRDWNAAVSELVEGDPERRELHGLEAFFRSAGAAPPAWKMAILTWIAVNPAVYVFASGVPAVAKLPWFVELLVVNGFVVAALTWALMPLLTRVARPWLTP